ncbi:MAG: hypothetical protein PHN74_00155 [Candidatus Pacebacteria bacterium]|nr:hypothetical protein [Candidatus Paceibacterota bacterium]
MKVRIFLLLAVMVLILSACGTFKSELVRYQYVPYNQSELKQTKENVTLEKIDSKTTPEHFYFSAPKRDAYGRAQVDSNGRAIITRGCVRLKGQIWEQFIITNNTNRVLRLGKVSVRLIDPAGNQYYPLTRQDLITATMQVYGISLNEVNTPFNFVKVIDNLTEVLPNMSFTGWLVFYAPTSEMPGVWKIGIYDMPVKTEESGEVKKVAFFEFNTVLKKFVDIYEQSGMFGKSTLVETKEVK